MGNVYDGNGNVLTYTDGNGNVTTYAYDALGRITTVTNAKGVATTYTYDALGNILTATDAAGTVSYAYDALGRCVSVTDRNGNTQSFTYDAKGQIVMVTDKNGNETVYTYDGNGNIIKTTDALGTEVLFEYNANDQLTKMTQNRVDSVHEQSEQLITLYQYDGRNLVTKVVRSSGDEELYTYDGNGNMLTKTDGDGYVTEYSYNSLDLVSHINYNDAKEVTYQYDKVGNLVKMDDWLGTTTFEVDLLGQLTKMTDHKGNVVEYTYDAVGNQTSVTYPDETTVTKTYDEVYNLTNVKDAENQNYLYQYDDTGRVTKLTYPNGWVEDYTYDNEGNLLKTVDTDPFHNNKKSTKYEYRYDAEGNLVSEYKRDTTAANRALTTTYTYDALNRLTAAHEEGIGVNTTRTYQYDTLGNMIREEQDGCIEYRYNGYSLDESTKCGTIPNSIGTAYWEYTYDGRGNLVSNDKYTRTTSGMDWQNVETYVYDETNHMVQGKNELGEISIYTYNGLGIRVGRELVMKDNTHGYTDFHDLTPSVETGIDKPEVVKESYVIDYTSATYNTLVMDEEGGFNYRWTYGLDKLNVKITSEGTNWWGQHVTTDILKDYLHQDRLGSTTNLTDTFGRIVGRADYNEWGEVTYKEALSITSSYRRIYPQLNYTGHDWDDVLSMYYAKARFYSADDKRFVAMDPVKGQITDPLSLVSYLYCVDNPLRYVDPLGMRITSLPAEITGNNVNFRAEPSLTATSYLQFQKGMRVVDLGRRVDADGYRWTNVQYNGLTGWVATNYLRVVSTGSSQNTYRPVAFDSTSPDFHTYDDAHPTTSTSQNKGLPSGKVPSLGDQQMVLYDGPTVGNNTPVLSAGPMEQFDCPDAANQFDPLGYLYVSAKQVVQGNYAEEVTLLGTIGEIAIGFTGLDVVADVRDVIYDIQHWEWSWENFGRLAIDSIGLLPIVGILKSSDEVMLLAKRGDDIIEITGQTAKHGNDAVDALGNMSKHAGNAEDIVGNVVKHSDEVVDAVGDVAKRSSEVNKILNQAENLAEVTGKAFKRYVKGNFRENLHTLTDIWGEQAHHIFPQKFRDEFYALGINVDNPLFGAWVDAVPHSKWSNAYNAAWNAFFNSGNPTTDGAFALVRILAAQYGFQLNF